MQRIIHRIKRHKILLISILSIFVVYFSMVIILYTTDTDTFKGNTSYSGVSVENLTTAQAYDALKNHVSSVPVTIEAGDATLSTYADKLGADIDAYALSEDINSQKIRYAFLPIIYKKEFQIPITTNQDRLITTARSIELPENKKPPIDASVDYVDNKIKIIPEASGDGLDTTAITQELLKQLQSGAKSVSFTSTISTVSPRVTAELLTNRINDIKQILAATYTISNGNKEITLPANEIAKSLYINESNQLLPTHPAATTIISNAIKQYYIAPIPQLLYTYASGKENKVFQVGNPGKIISNEPELIDQLITAVASAESKTIIATSQSTDFETKEFVIQDTTKKVITYSIETWGNTTSSIADFREKATETLLSELGWNRANYTFEEVPSGGDFSLVLSEGKELSRRYTPACDEYYSCRYGRYVIINDSRWQNATPVWTKSIRDYQHLVINHEVGHLLGLGHSFCSKPGDLAPVMQQQSIELRGCVFNSWPLPNEITALKE